MVQVVSVACVQCVCFTETYLFYPLFPALAAERRQTAIEKDKCSSMQRSLQQMEQVCGG